MPEGEESARRSGIGATVEQLTKVIALFAIVCYVIGLFITNTYLQSVDVTDFSPLKVRFVYSGFTALICIGLIEIFLLQAALGFLDDMEKKGYFEVALSPPGSLAVAVLKRALKNPGVVFTLLGVFVVSLFVQFMQHPHYSLPGKLVASIGILSLILLVPIFGGLAIWVVSDWKRISKLSKAQKTLMVLWLGLFFLGGLVWLLVWYAQVVLPAIPEQFGGTRPRIVRLLVTDSQVKSLEKSGVQVESGTSLTMPIRLIYESDEWISVDIRGTHLSIDRKNVIAMKVEPGRVN